MSLPLLLAAVTALSYPPSSYVREKTFDSLTHTFQVESWRKGTQDPDAALCLWVIGSDQGAAELLVAPGVLTPLYAPEVRISPDERWILWEEKLYHPANAYGLFERVAGLHFQEIGPPRFDEQAWQFMAQQTHRRFNTEDSTHIVRVSGWPTPGSHVAQLALYGDAKLTPVATPNDHSLVLSLYGDDHKTQVNLWFCYYDLHQRRFYLDAALRKHNHNRVGPSRHR